MKQAKAEKRLGGHATGTLTEEERSQLFAAALDHQDVFDALMDEEALRELLADPAARAQLLVALAPAPPKVIPFWRRSGVLGAAASLLMAATAGLLYVRHPLAPQPLETQEKAKVAPATSPIPTPVLAVGPARAQPPAKSPAPQVMAPSTVPERQGFLARSTKEDMGPPPAPSPAGPLAPPATPSEAFAREVSSAGRATEQRRDEARDPMAKAQQAQDSASASASNYRASGLAGGLVGGLAAEAHPTSAGGRVSPQATEAKKAKLSPSAAVVEVVAEVAPAEAPAQDREGPKGVNLALANPAPAWALELQSDGSMSVTVWAPVASRIVLLRRGLSGIEVLKARTGGPWRYSVRLATEDVMDLYLLNHPTADPAHLPAVGPVDGFRARIHPPKR